MSNKTTNNSDKGIEYLFLSITEVHVAGTIEPIQISLSGIDEEFNLVRNFSKGIKPDNIDKISDEQLKLVGSCRQNILVSTPKDEIFKRVANTFYEYANIVVWEYNTYQLLKANMDRLGIKLPKHKVICVKDILQYVATDEDMYSSFEDALLDKCVAYGTNDINYSKQRVEYLKELYITSFIQYKALVSGEVMSANTRSRVIHHKTCRFAKSTACINSDKSKVFVGYVPCKLCSKHQEYKKFSPNDQVLSGELAPKNQPNNVEYLKTLRYNPLTARLICNYFGLTLVDADMDFAEVQTNVGSWKIYISGNRVIKLLHRRLIFNKSGDDFEYHRQQRNVKKIFDTLEYIYNHDKNFLGTSKKTKMERLFEQIENERKYKKHG